MFPPKKIYTFMQKSNNMECQDVLKWPRRLLILMIDNSEETGTPIEYVFLQNKIYLQILTRSVKTGIR